MRREIQMTDGALDVWCHLAPFGEFPGRRGGETVVQVCDRQALEAVARAFSAEVLVDFEHRAENTDDTTAAAWIQALEIRGDGLWARLRFTDVGAEAVRGRRLRFLSPVWTLAADGRPEALKSAALTNTPNFDLRPVLNKAGDVTKTPKGSRTMKELAALYGLPETATEAEILAAAKADREKTAALETRLAELEKAALKAEAETVAGQNEAKIENKRKFVELYVANKAFALELLGVLKAPPHVCNKADARPPDAFVAPVQNKLAQYEAMPEGRDKAAFLRANAQEINTLRNARAREE